MTHRLATNCAKNYCNRTLIVKVIVENVVTCFFWDTVYIMLHCQPRERENVSPSDWAIKSISIGNFTSLAVYRNMPNHASKL